MPEIKALIEQYRLTVESFKSRDESLGQYINTIYQLFLAGDTASQQIAMHHLEQLASSYK